MPSLPATVKMHGRPVELHPYYDCPYCGAASPAIVWGGCLDYRAGIVGDGVLEIFVRAPATEPAGFDGCVVLIEEVGRIPCLSRGAHVYYRWDWAADVDDWTRR